MQRRNDGQEILEEDHRSIKFLETKYSYVFKVPDDGAFHVFNPTSHNLPINNSQRRPLVESFGYWQSQKLFGTPSVMATLTPLVGHHHLLLLLLLPNDNNMLLLHPPGLTHLFLPGNSNMTTTRRSSCKMPILRTTPTRHTLEAQHHCKLPKSFLIWSSVIRKSPSAFVS